VWNKGVLSLRNRPLFDTVEILFLFAAGLQCLMTFWSGFRAVPALHQMDFGEGPVLAAGVRAAQGLAIYPPATRIPHIINVYGPVPYYLVALCVKLFGVSFTAPRILVVVSGIWCATLIALLIRHWGGAPHVGLAFGLLYLTRPVVCQWLFVLRVDLIGLAFSLTGLYLFTKPRRWHLSIPFFVAGLFCKFVLVSAPLACFLYAVLRRETRKAVWFAASSLAMGALAFLWAQHETAGWFAFHTVWSLLGHPYSLSGAYHAVRDHLATDYYLVVLAIALGYYSRSRRNLWLPLIYLGATFLTLFAIGKKGANSNYFLEWEAALCLTAGVAYQLLRAHADRRSIVSALLPATLAALVVANTPAPYLIGEGYSYSGCPQAYGYVRNSPGERILSENIGAVLVAGKFPLVSDPFAWTREVVDSGWPDTDIINLIRSRQVELIVLAHDVRTVEADSSQERWPKSVAEAIEHNYQLVRTFDCAAANFVYQPETPPRQPGG
jgi:hypothetical protein